MERLNPLLPFVACLFVALFSNSCIDQFAGRSDEDGRGSEDRAPGAGSVYRELRDERRLLERRLSDLRRDGDRRDELVQEELAATAVLDEIRDYERRLRLLHGEAKSQLQAWREATRGSFVGVRLPEIEAIDGAKWTDVTILGVGDDILRISHAGGEAEIEILRLPLGLRKNLIHEPTALAERDL